MPKKVFRAVYALNFIMQTAFCFLTPPGLLIIGGWYLKNRCGWGGWVLAVAIVFGVIAGAWSMFNFLRNSVVDPTEGKGDKDGRTSN